MDKETLLNAGYAITTVPVKKQPGLFLWGEFMHGDADHYTKEGTKLESVEELEAIILYLNWIDSMTHNGRIDYLCRTKFEKKENDFYAQVGEKWREEGLFDAVLDWWPHDVTYDDVPASLQNFWAIFVDENGIEYTVKKIQ